MLKRIRVEIKGGALPRHVKPGEKFVLTIPKHVKYVYDLQDHLLSVLDMEGIPFKLKLDDYELLPREEIANIIMDDDLIMYIQPQPSLKNDYL